MPVWQYKELVYDESPEVWHDPTLLPDYAEGIRLITKHIDEGNVIAVIGDKDADGVNAAAILAHILFDVGAKVIPYAPARDEGHGIQPRQVDYFEGLDARLIITADEGSVAFPAMKVAHEYGIDMVITDHHNVADGPNEYGFPVINPKRPDSSYPFTGICGAVLSLKVGQGILKHYGFPQDYWMRFLDFASVATIGDVMPLIGENRWIVKRGIEMLNKHPNVGYRQIVDEMAHVQFGRIDERTLGWSFAPMINATGRVATPSIALGLLLNEDKTDVSHVKRTRECNDKKREIVEAVMNDPDIQPEMYPVMWLCSDRLIEGILGLVANKLGDREQRPAMCACPIPGGRIKGSGRTFGGFEIYDFLMSLPEEWFEARGGHNEAVGFTLYQEFLSDFEAELRKAHYEPKDVTYVYHQVLQLKDVTEELMQRVENGKPYGEKYPQPVFLAEDVTVSNLRTSGFWCYAKGTQGKGTQEETTAQLKFDPSVTRYKENYDLLFTLERMKDLSIRLVVVDWRLTGTMGQNTTFDSASNADVESHDPLAVVTG